MEQIHTAMVDAVNGAGRDGASGESGQGGGGGKDRDGAVGPEGKGAHRGLVCRLRAGGAPAIRLRGALRGRCRKQGAWRNRGCANDREDPAPDLRGARRREREAGRVGGGYFGLTTRFRSFVVSIRRRMERDLASGERIAPERATSAPTHGWVTGRWLVFRPARDTRPGLIEPSRKRKAICSPFLAHLRGLR